MPLLQLVMTLIVVGVLLWLVNRFIPMAGSIKSILNAVVVIGVVVWLLNVFGFLHSLSRIRVGTYPDRNDAVSVGAFRTGDHARNLFARDTGRATSRS
jgi:cation transporter-like permease